jgi:eukaryotic-like serine/threonine-protein kinase
MVRAMHGVMRAGSLLADRYRLDSPIGRGAMGVVWRGRDELLERDVAVKEVRVPAMVTPDDAGIIYQRTLREAKTAARLNHPGVATVYDVFEQDGSPWIVMELVRARALDQVITEDGSLRPLAAARVGESLLSALTCAHAAGVLHRDVKPSNVLLGQDGRGVLTDFGIATFEGDPGLTQVGMVVGTPGFTAPERLRGQPATPAADLWSLGATRYAAVEGRGPFERAGGPAAIMAGVVNEDAPRAPSAGPLTPVIEALLSPDPAARPEHESWQRESRDGRPGRHRADRRRGGRRGRRRGGAPTSARSPGPAASNPAAAGLPAGYRWYTVSGASSGATAGFTIAVPDAWQASRQGLVTYLTSPSGGTRAAVSLTPFTLPDPVREARLQRREAIRQGRYPGYAGIIVPGTFHGAADAWRRFGYRQPVGRVAVLDLLVSLATSAGDQPYALSMSAPKPDAPAAAQVFQEMLQTFQPAP